MSSNDLFALLSVVGLTSLATFLSYKVSVKIKNYGVRDDMAFRLIWLIGAFGALYVANMFREQISKYSMPELINQGLAGAILLVGLYSAFVLVLSFKTKLQELGRTKIWKKLLYSAVISSAVAWISTLMGITEAITLAKVAIGGAVVFSIQLFG